MKQEELIPLLEIYGRLSADSHCKDISTYLLKKSEEVRMLTLHLIEDLLNKTKL